MTLILSMASPDLVTVVPIETSPGPHVSGYTWVSPGPGVSGTHLGSIRIWLHCTLTVTQPDLSTLVFTWATPAHGDTGSHLGLVDMVSRIPTWASPVTGDSRSHMESCGLGGCSVSSFSCTS